MTTYLIFFSVTALLFLTANFVDRKTEYAHPIWLLYLLPLLSMILMYGLRDGWMVDFFIYKYNYEHTGQDVLYEPLFVGFLNVMRAMNFSYNGALTVWATFTIGGYFLVAAQKRQLTGAIMVLFMTVSIAYISNTIRWSFAGGFVWASLALLNRRQYIWAAACGICAPLIHLSIIPILAIMWLLWWFPFLPKWYYTIPLTLLTLMISPAMIAEFLFSIATGIFDSGGVESDLNVTGYVSDENAIDKYFAGESAEMSGTLSFVLIVRYFMLFIWYLYEGYQYVSEHKTRLNRMLYVGAMIFILTWYPTWGIELALRFSSFGNYCIAMLAAPIIYWEFRKGRYAPMALACVLLLTNWWTAFKGASTEYVLKYMIT